MRILETLFVLHHRNPASNFAKQEHRRHLCAELIRHISDRRYSQCRPVNSVSGQRKSYRSHELIASNYMEVLDVLSFTEKADDNTTVQSCISGKPSAVSSPRSTESRHKSVW